MKNVKYAIFQTTSRTLKFTTINELKSFEPNLDPINQLDVTNEEYQYSKVYDSTIDVPEESSNQDVLNILYEKFNMNRPTDYKARSVSVSDIIEIKGKKYYVDGCGFQELKK